jgi:hypothetical protein
VAEDELFKTPDGFQDALNGVYTSCTQQSLYGFELSCGFPEALAQNYYMEPDDNLHYKQTANYIYTDPFFVTRKDTVWTGLYHGIANCNLILKNVETNKDVLTGDMYALIKAEALALRGYLHFDLLRLFAPSFKSNPNAKAIPYVTEFSNKVTSLSTVTEVLNNVTADLSQAKELIRPVDPILSPSYVPSYATDSNGRPEEQQNPNLFLQNRRHRLNYYAICGELARVNLYQEKMTDALSNALEVINSNKFPWVVTSDFTQTDTKKKDRIMYKELLFAWYIPSMKDTLAAKFNAGVNSLVIDVDAGDALYEKSTAGARDLRLSNWLLQSGATTSPTLYELQKYRRDPETNLYDLVIPALRLSEMYYIASESSYDADPVKSVQYLNTVRRNRGGILDVVVSSKDQLINELVKEERKECYGEGQIFYMYKRLNRNFPNLTGGIISTSDKIFVMPLPNDEIEFGQR